MHAFLFDIDGTLLSSGGAGKAAMYAAIESEFRVRELHDNVPFAGRTDRAITRDLFAGHRIEDTPENFRRFVASYLGHLPGKLREKQGRVLPGVAELLNTLSRQAGAVVGLLTGNLREGARAKLSHFGIFHYFRCGGFGDEHLDRDDVAREAMDDLRSHAREPITLDRVWVIGDTPLDIRCARAVGARALAVATGMHSIDDLASERPDLLVENLSLAEPLLEELDGF